MGLEAAAYIAELVETNPDGAVDPKSAGDNHIRNIKLALKNTFSGHAGRVWRTQTKSVNYTIVLNDAASIVKATGTITLAFAAAATLGNGFECLVRAAGGEVTLDPNAAELINDVATLVLRDGDLIRVTCDGTAFVGILLETRDSDAVNTAASMSATITNAGGSPYITYGRPTILDSKSYTFAAPLVMPADAQQGKIMVFEGVGGTMAHKPFVVFSATGAHPYPQWDFGSMGPTKLGYPTHRNLMIQHAAGIPGTPADMLLHGIGLDYGAVGSFGVMDNVDLHYFNVGHRTTGLMIYGYLEHAHFLYNYTYGAWWNGAINHTPMRHLKFSKTQAGSGLRADNLGSGGTLRDAFAEGNYSGGVELSNYHTVHLDSFYAEANANGYDVYSTNVYPSQKQHLMLTNNYHDVQQWAANPRIWASMTSFDLRGSMFYNDYEVPPVFRYPQNGTTPFGSRLFAVGTRYRTRYLTNQAYDAGSVIFDKKHPTPGILHSFGPPTGMMGQEGQIFKNINPATQSSIWGWEVTIPGWLGTLPAVGQTAYIPTIVGTYAGASGGVGAANAKRIQLDVATNWWIDEGDWITVAGVTFEGAAATMVVDAATGPVLITEKAANTPIGPGAAINYQAGQLRTLPAPNTISGADALLAQSGVACASGANTLLAQVVIPANHKLLLKLLWMLTQETNVNTGSGGEALVFVAYDSATIEFSSNVVANVVTPDIARNASDGALAHSVILTDSGGGILRVFMNHLTGGPLLCSVKLEALLSTEIAAFST